VDVVDSPPPVEDEPKPNLVGLKRKQTELLLKKP